ncbi:response regulator, partial [bacterium]|nr:response regulator [bacterium]
AGAEERAPRGLVVARSASARRRLLRAVERTGIPAHAVDSVSAAIDELAIRSTRMPFGMIVLDPGQEPDACERLIAGEIGCAAVVVVAERGSRGDAGRYRRAGADGYAALPAGDEEIARVIQAAFTQTQHSEFITRHWLREHTESLLVLIADDSLTNRALAQKLLERRGHEVIAVPSGAASIKAMAQRDIDVVLMDVQMPGMDGLEATSRIRALERGGDVPIIALTAHAMESDRARCIDAGMDEYLSKPFAPDELYSVVERLAGRYRAVAAPRHAADDAGQDAHSEASETLETARPHSVR